MEKRKVIIIGSGPAGVSTALSLKQTAPHLAEEMLILEKEQHPREKLCGGAVTNYAYELLESLEIDSTAAGFPVHTVTILLDSKAIHFHKKNLFRIVRREEFDADLVEHVKNAGIEIRENHRVIDIRRQNGRFEVITDKDSFMAKVIVGADGANGIVRRKLISKSDSRVSRLIEILVKVDPEKTEEFTTNTAVLDFRMTNKNLQGYLWYFPSFIAQEAHLNVGIFDSRIHESDRADLKQLLLQKIAARGLNSEEILVKGHPERWFKPDGVYACPNVVLVGDAAGLEPLFGEGISVALAYGPIAAEAIKNAFKNEDFSFQSYKSLILRSRLAKLLNRNRLTAQYFYSNRWRFIIPPFIKTFQTYVNFRANGLGIEIEKHVESF